jgi:hypothetical protein
MTDQPVVPAFEPSPEYLAREKRFNDAVNLTKPDRVPVASLAAFLCNSLCRVNKCRGNV